MCNSSKGFSLVELIIVIAIMAILAGAPLSGPRAASMTSYGGETILYDYTTADLSNYLRKCFDSHETNKNKAKYVVIYFSSDNDGSIESATWATKKSDNLVGSYPTPAVGKSTQKYGTYYYKPNTGDQ